MSNKHTRYVIHSRAPSPAEWDAGATPTDIARDLGTPGCPIDVDPSIGDVMGTLFGLGSRDVDTFRALVGAPGSTTQDLSDELGLHRSNANRSLSVLIEMGLATRRRRILTTGGHVYEYAAPPQEELHAHLQAVLEEWSATASNRLAEFVSGVAPADAETETAATWLDRLLLRETGDVTPTEEYVFHHGAEMRSRAGEPVPDAVERGEWSSGLRAELVAEGSRDAVVAALERLQEADYLERVDPATQDDREGPYWRLTAAGRAERERLTS